MRRNPNQRLWVRPFQGVSAWESASWRSTVIGWWSVTSSGQPSSSIPSSPEPSDWLSWTMSSSPLRRGKDAASPHGEGERLGEARART